MLSTALLTFFFIEDTLKIQRRMLVKLDVVNKNSEHERNVLNANTTKIV